jgi:hypothetical protein
VSEQEALHLPADGLRRYLVQSGPIGEGLQWEGLAADHYNAALTALRAANPTMLAAIIRVSQVIHGRRRHSRYFSTISLLELAGLWHGEREVSSQVARAGAPEAPA